ncbi:hypothetical protein [Mycobacterium sp. URHB0044]|nr:hypothetical protein [Mycobacterium sp. URHB0044]
MNTSFDDWPIEAQVEVQKLRAECAKHRIDRNKARAELAALRAEVGK